MTVLELARTPAGWFGRTRRKTASGSTARMTTSAALVIGTTALLLGGGLIMILSSSWVSAYEAGASPFTYFMRQLMWAFVGIACLIVAAVVDYRRWRSLSYFMMLAALVGLMLVLHPAFGTTAGGSSRWLSFGPIRFQPSELWFFSYSQPGSGSARIGTRAQS